MALCLGVLGRAACFLFLMVLEAPPSATLAAALGVFLAFLATISLHRVFLA